MATKNILTNTTPERIKELEHGGSEITRIPVQHLPSDYPKSEKKIFLDHMMNKILDNQELSNHAPLFQIEELMEAQAEAEAKHGEERVANLD